MEEFDWDLSSGDRRALPAILYVHLAKALARYKDLLLRARRRGALDYAAWITRNILELRVWIEYCSQSQRHAEEFFEDAVRDLNDLNRVVGGLDPEDVLTLQKAHKFIGNTKPAHKFKRVEAAAKEVGLTPMYESNNKILSKLVHPTAMSLLTPSFRTGIADKLRAELVEVGMKMAGEALEKLENSLLGQTFRTYQQRMNAVIAKLPNDKRPF